jgi:hypothetical protein
MSAPDGIELNLWLADLRRGCAKRPKKHPDISKMLKRAERSAEASQAMTTSTSMDCLMNALLKQGKDYDASLGILL